MWLTVSPLEKDANPHSGPVNGQLHIVILTPNSLLMSLLKVWSHTCHLLCIYYLRMSTRNMKGLTHHPDCFVDVDLEDHTIKKPRQETQGLLEPARPGRGEKDVISLEQLCHPLECLPEVIWSRPPVTRKTQ